MGLLAPWLTVQLPSALGSTWPTDCYAGVKWWLMSSTLARLQCPRLMCVRSWQRCTLALLTDASHSASRPSSEAASPLALPSSTTPWTSPRSSSPRPGEAVSRGRRRRTGPRRSAVPPRPRLAKLERSKVPGLARNFHLPCGPLSSHWIYFSVNKWKNPNCLLPLPRYELCNPREERVKNEAVQWHRKKK